MAASACSDPLASLRADWRQCVNNAFGAESAKTADRTKAAEAAVQSCQAKEDVLFRKARETIPDADRTRADFRRREVGRLVKQAR
jgi:hypothetical protein